MVTNAFFGLTKMAFLLSGCFLSCWQTAFIQFDPFWKGGDAGKRKIIYSPNVEYEKSKEE